VSFWELLLYCYTDFGGKLWIKRYCFPFPSKNTNARQRGGGLGNVMPSFALSQKKELARLHEAPRLHPVEVHTACHP
jgi:hypothetical protein